MIIPEAKGALRARGGRALVEGIGDVRGAGERKGVIGVSFRSVCVEGQFHEGFVFQ